jgi:NAD(P)-dependent dehydrogenase (short-subunit alcohol dehydrogenase family)
MRTRTSPASVAASGCRCVKNNSACPVTGLVQKAACVPKDIGVHHFTADVDDSTGAGGWPGWGVYGAAKAGLENFSRSLYLELRPHGVRVTTVVPSWGATGFNASAQIPDLDEEKRRKCIFPSDLGKLVADICALPKRLWLQELILWPVEQEVNPL